MKCVDNIESLLGSVLRWLENEDENDKWWQLQTQVVQLCLLELDLILKAEKRTRSDTWTQPGADPLSSVSEMVHAMNNRNRRGALEFGKLALAQLSNWE